MLMLIRKKYETKNQNKNKFQAFNNNNNNMTAATATIVAASTRTIVARISAKCIYHRISVIKETQLQQQEQQHHQVLLRQQQQQQHTIHNTFKHHNSIVFNQCSVKVYSMQILSRKVSPVHSAIAPIVGTAHCGDICVKSAVRVNQWSVPFVVIVPSVPIICGNM